MTLATWHIVITIEREKLSIPFGLRYRTRNRIHEMRLSLANFKLQRGFAKEWSWRTI